MGETRVYFILIRSTVSRVSNKAYFRAPDVTSYVFFLIPKSVGVEDTVLKLYLCTLSEESHHTVL